MRTPTILLLLSTSLLMACQADTADPAPSKEEVARAHGKNDIGEDLCLVFGFYDDGVCDPFCPSPDPDCGGLDCPDPLDPAVHYAGGSFDDSSICLISLIGCEEGQTPFSDDCGCGCIDDEPVCPDPNDPGVHYLAGSDQNPSACSNILFACEDDQTPFYDDVHCGCGCIDDEPVCPDPNDPGVHYMAGSDQNPSACSNILFTCEDDQTPFYDDVHCGCGCIDDAPVCPDPNDPKVHYFADSDENPDVCLVIFFTCDPGQTLFSDGSGCGCGCIDP